VYQLNLIVNGISSSRVAAMPTQRELFELALEAGDYMFCPRQQPSNFFVIPIGIGRLSLEDAVTYRRRDTACEEL